MRITIERTIWSKLQTQLQKKENGELARELREQETSTSPSKDTILWDPPPALIAKVRILLEREQTFMRKKESASYLLMTKVIQRLKSYEGG